jgi:nucleoid DNA-binding protein
MSKDNADIGKIPKEIEEHLAGLVRSLDPSDPKELFQRLQEGWIEKERLFTSQTEMLDMEIISGMSKEDSRGCILLTNSGSLLALSPEGSWMEYASIPIRSDVPEILLGKDVAFEAPLSVGDPALLSHGSLKKTSPIYRIAVCKGDTPATEQEKRIREAMIFLTNGFARINKSIEAPNSGEIEHFTKQGMVNYVAKRNGLSQKAVKSVIEDFFTMVESGVLLGERVPLGNLGRISYKVQGPRKARVVKNPSSGEEMTIPAKPSRAVVAFSVSGALKERAEGLPVDDLE